MYSSRGGPWHRAAGAKAARLQGCQANCAQNPKSLDSLWVNPQTTDQLERRGKHPDSFPEYSFVAALLKCVRRTRRRMKSVSRSSLDAARKSKAGTAPAAQLWQAHKIDDRRLHQG